MYVTELQQLKEMEQAPGRSMPSEGCWRLNGSWSAKRKTNQQLIWHVL